MYLRILCRKAAGYIFRSVNAYNDLLVRVSVNPKLIKKWLKMLRVLINRY